MELTFRTRRRELRVQRKQVPLPQRFWQFWAKPFWVGVTFLPSLGLLAFAAAELLVPALVLAGLFWLMYCYAWFATDLFGSPRIRLQTLRLGSDCVEEVCEGEWTRISWLAFRRVYCQAGHLILDAQPSLQRSFAIPLTAISVDAAEGAARIIGLWQEAQAHRRARVPRQPYDPDQPSGCGEVAYQLTPAESAECRLQPLQPPKHTTWFHKILLGVLALSFAFMVTWSSTTASLWWARWTCVAAACLLPPAVFQLVLAGRRHWQLRRGPANDQDPRKIVLSSEGIYIQGVLQERFWSWKNVQAILDDQRYLVIWRPRALLHIPWRAFSTPEHRAAFVSAARRLQSQNRDEADGNPNVAEPRSVATVPVVDTGNPYQPPSECPDR